MKKVLLIMGLALAGCGWSNVKQTPPTAMDPVQAQHVIGRLLRERTPSQYIPETVEIGEDYFRVSDVRIKKSGVMRYRHSVAVPVTNTVYYDRVRRTELFEKGDLFQVIVYGDQDKELYRYYDADQAKAQQFIAVLTSLAHL